jgi:ComF family protein
MMADYWALDPVPVDIMAPVPMHARRFRERGYNQAELLAREVAGRIGLKLEANLLERVNHVSPQAKTASGSERMLNVAGSVAISTEVDLAGMRVLLVDDVATTGSTLDACAAVLKDAGASEVWGLVLAVAGGQ